MICEYLSGILNQYAYSPYYFVYINLGADKENLSNNQELLEFVII